MKYCFLTLAIFLVFAAPWYGRNIALAGDPISPILNLQFRGSDPIFSKNDYAAVLQVLHLDAQPPLLAPILLFFSPALFQEVALPFNLVLLYVPIAVLAVLVLLRKLRSANLGLLVFALCSSYAVLATFLVSDSIGRYIIEFYAVYLVTVAISLYTLLGKLFSSSSPPARYVAMTCSSIAVACSSLPLHPEIESQTLTAQFSNIVSRVGRPSSELNAVPGYTAAESVATLINQTHANGNVLTIGGERLAYYFRAMNIGSVGDWFGPGRYADLALAIDHGTVGKYLKDFNISAVTISPDEKPLSPPQLSSLLSYLHAAHFIATSQDGAQDAALVSPQVARAAVSMHLLDTTPEAGLSLLQSFDLGEINSEQPASTPTHKGVLTFSWPSDTGNYNSITVLSGYTYRFAHVHVLRSSRLRFKVAKGWALGTDAYGWVSVTTRRGTKRLVTVECPPAEGNQPVWKTFDVPVSPTNDTVTITFGASSIPGGGTADWIAFADPFITDAQVKM